MLNQVLVALICAGISISVIGVPAILGPPTAADLNNEFVGVSIVPPLNTSTHIIADCASTTGHPFVRLFVPTRSVAPASDVSKNPIHNNVSAEYFTAREIFGCSGSLGGSFVYVDLKLMPIDNAFHDDAVRADSVHNEVLLENTRVRIVRVHFAPGESGPMVDKRPRVIFAVTGSHATVTFPDGHSEMRDMKAGTVLFGDAGRQATKNTGTTPIENIVVELKSKDSEKK